MLNKDLNLFALEKIDLALSAGENTSTVATSTAHSIMFLVDLSTVTGFTSIDFKVLTKSNAVDAPWVEATAFGATKIVFANLDSDANKRIFSIGAASGDSGMISLVATVVGNAAGAARIYALQEAIRNIDANSNKR